MKSSFKKIIFVLIILAILPVIFYSGYEISSLSENEKIVSQIYEKQLDAVLYSVNQYSWDAVSNWVTNIHRILSESKHAERDLDGILNTNTAIRNIWVMDSTKNFIHFSGSVSSDSIKKTILDTLNFNEVKIRRLDRFQKADYRKIEPFILTENRVMLIFVSNTNIAGLILDSPEFVEKVLGPKLVNVASNEFILAIVNSNSKEVVFGTEKIKISEIKNRKTLWIFPDHFLTIRLKGATIEEVVQSRFWRNILIILILNALLIAGSFVVYRTFKKEIELVEMKTDFVSNVSHELRTPLSLIRMFAETLEMGRVKTEEKKLEYYQIIIGETERLTRLINNLLNFSRMDVNKRVFNFVEVDLNRRVLAILDVFQFQLKSNNFNIITDLDEYLSFVTADQEALEEAILNLLENAMKYSTENKVIKIRTGKTDDHIFVEVQDQGIGISKENHKKIFDKFYRVSSGLIHTTKGSGLGLSIVQYIMNAHFGKIEVVSEPGKGSTFRLLFPREN